MKARTQVEPAPDECAATPALSEAAPMQGTGDPATDLPALLASAGRGDEAAWRRLLDLYSRRVFALVKSRCKRDDVAEEITQSVFVTIAAKLGTGGYGEQGRFESWLFRIAMNRVRDEVRRSRTRAGSADPATLDQRVGTDDRDGAAGLAARDGAGIGRLREAVGTLGEQDREVVELRHHAGMSFKHIAELLGQPLGTVLARHHRALRKLKDLLGSSDDDRDESRGEQ